MSSILKRTVKVTKINELAAGIISMWILEPEIAKLAKAGQFLNVYPNSEARLLPRPISICEIDQTKGELRMVFRVAGAGTKEFSKLGAGDEIAVMGPLGNGYQIEGEHPILIGGGIGIPPMLQLAKSIKGDKTIVLGYRNQDTFLLDEFKQLGNVVIATEDGSIGTKGNVIDACKENKIVGDMIYSCGPKPMLKGVKEYAQKLSIEAQISLEERMACGVGACLGCVCKSKEKDSHSHVNNKRVCKDGPVFYAKEVEL